MAIRDCRGIVDAMFGYRVEIDLKRASASARV
jgi:hypothetical protein